jgi:nucleotide-binding universal stress UspA family protein
MYDDILVPTDGSAGIETVLDHTADLATRHDATVHALYVIDDRSFLTLDEEMKSDVVDDLRTEGERATETVADRLQSSEIDVSTAIRRGTPAEVILSYIDEADIDIVTMGTQADEYEKNMLGSTSQKVVARSSVPVLTIDVPR